MHTLAALFLFIFGSLEVDTKGDRSKIDETTVSWTVNSMFNEREQGSVR